MKKLLISLTITASATLMFGVGAYPVTLDEYERRNGNGSRVMAPGYINIDKQRSESMKESIKTQDLIAEGIDADLNRSMLETQPDMVTPDLQKKTGMGDDTQDLNTAETITLDAEQRQQVIVDLYNVVKGKVGASEGGSPVYDVNLDIDDSGGISLTDVFLVLMLTRPDLVSDSQYETIFSKLMAGTEARIGLASGDSNYYSAFDVDNDGTITIVDYNAMHSAIGSGRTNLPSSPFQQTASLQPSLTLQPYRYHALGYNALSGYGSTFNTSPESSSATLSNTNLSGPFKSLLDSANLSDSGMMVDAGQDQMTLKQSALAVAAIKEAMNAHDRKAIAKLAAILANPTEDQKQIINSIKGLLQDMDKLQDQTGENPELKKVSDEFAQMAATVLLAQALPDLLKEGDIGNIKAIFSELDTKKSHVLLEYQTSVKMYYDSIVKELASNMALLQLKDILSKQITKDELGNLSHERIDEIIRKMKDVKDKTVTEKEILKHEAEYREEHLIPAEKAFEENMKTLLQAFTQRLMGVLDETGLVKGEAKEGKAEFNIDLSAK